FYDRGLFFPMSVFQGLVQTAFCRPFYFGRIVKLQGRPQNPLTSANGSAILNPSKTVGYLE
ncbi:MAG: hypothetical protein Q4A88_08760, partial [Clostridia bacterium]|nr:hypothetical protein [Clostridia bacterium]